MSVTYGSKWTILPGSTASVVTSAALHISISSSGGNLGGNYMHSVAAKGVVLYSGTANRSYRVSSYRNSGSGFTNIANAALDVYGLPADATALNTFLTNMAFGDILVLTTYDEPNNNKGTFSQNLIDNFGAKMINNIAYRYCYQLVAVKGRGVIYENFGLDTQFIAASMYIGS